MRNSGTFGCYIAESQNKSSHNSAQPSYSSAAQRTGAAPCRAVHAERSSFSLISSFTFFCSCTKFVSCHTRGPILVQLGASSTRLHSAEDTVALVQQRSSVPRRAGPCPAVPCPCHAVRCGTAVRCCAMLCRAACF